MLNIEIDERAGVLILTPNGELSKDDFLSAARIVDPLIEDRGELAGIVIHVEDFPGWDSFSSLLAHLRFVKDHHRKVSRVAFATDSPVGSLAETIANHFVSAEIRNFGFGEFDAAKAWVTTDSA